MDLKIEDYHLKSSSLFSFLTPEEISWLKGKILRKEYLKNETIFKENSFSKGIYIIRRGKVKIFQNSSEGKQSIVYIYRKEDYFGYRPLLANEPHPVSAVAMDHVVISFISRETFNVLLNRSSILAKKLLIVMSKEFSVWINKMTVFSQYGVKERVALSLLILGKIYQPNDETGKSTNITISRDDLAGFVGTAKESLVRMLRIFKDQKVISTKGAKITILKPQLLLDAILKNR